jgi:hypothetical protein
VIWARGDFENEKHLRCNLLHFQNHDFRAQNHVKIIARSHAITSKITENHGQLVDADKARLRSCSGKPSPPTVVITSTERITLAMRSEANAPIAALNTASGTNKRRWSSPSPRRLMHDKEKQAPKASIHARAGVFSTRSRRVMTSFLPVTKGSRGES